MENPKLHHFSFTVSEGYLEKVIELFTQFGFSIGYRENGANWCMLIQNPIPVDIQISEADDEPIDSEIKIRTHIAFLSKNPKLDIERVKRFCTENSLKIKIGNWTEDQFWFDLPDVFINFVIEIMDYKVIGK